MRGLRWAAAAVTGLLAVGGLPAVTATAASTAAATSLPVVTADPQPTWQTNGVVWATEVVGSVVYVGGSFSSVRPPGAAAGSQEVARRNLAAFDVATGALLPWAPDVRAPESTATTDITCQPGAAAGTRTCDTVYELQASSDGGRLYVGGDFNKIDGLAREKLAAFVTSTGKLDTAFKPAVNGRVRALAVTGTTVYAGGSFTRALPGTDRSRLAAFSRSNGSLLPWAPSVDNRVYALAMAPDGSRVILGGEFDTVNTTAIHGLAAVDATTGATSRWDGRDIPRVSSTKFSYVTDLVVDQDTVYASANGEGTFDGRLAADPYTGASRWVDYCAGATWSLALVRDVLYSGSHAHNCSSTPGGFPEAYNGILEANKRYYRFLAQDARSGTPTIQHWFPTTNGGIQGKLGPRTMATDGTHLWVGGEFTTVDGVAQQSLTRFTYADVAPDVGRPKTPDPVRVGTSKPGSVTVHFRGTEDLDDAHLTYELIRDHDTARPITVVEADSKPWDYPDFTYVDEGLAPGSTHTYDVRATDPDGNRSYRSAEVRATVASSAPAYAAGVLGDSPDVQWRMDERSGRTAVNGTGGAAGTYGAGVALGATGSTAGATGSTAATFSGTGTGVLRSTEKVAGRSSYSVEAWFRTTSTRGGKIVGFGTSNSTTGGLSSSYDRHVYMTNAGQLVFGANNPGRSLEVARSAASYNDGLWHQVVATMDGSGSGMSLYVDGELVATNPNTRSQPYEGYWGVGGDAIGSWPGAPSSSFFAGDLDEVSIYPFALTPAEAVRHHALGAPGATAPSTPAGATATVDGTSVQLTWVASTAAVGVTSYDVHRLASPEAVPDASTLVGTASGTSWSEDGVPPGTWTYRLVAKDAAGSSSAPSAATTVDVLAVPSTVRVQAAADASADSATPTTNRGGAWALTSRGTPEQLSYLRYDLPTAPPGTTLRSARLEVRTTDYASSGSVDAQGVSLATGAWDESTLTHAARPSVDGPLLGTLPGGTAASTSYSVDLSGDVLGQGLGGPTTLVLTSTGKDLFQIASSEAPDAASRPVLVLDFA